MPITMERHFVGYIARHLGVLISRIPFPNLFGEHAVGRRQQIAVDLTDDGVGLDGLGDVMNKKDKDPPRSRAPT